VNTRVQFEILGEIHTTIAAIHIFSRGLFFIGAPIYEIK